MSKLKKTLILAALATTMTANAKLIPYSTFHKAFNTVNPQVTSTLQGPMLDIKSADYSDYANKIIKIALEESHKNASEYLRTKEYKKYYAMMLMGLTVPMHEGLFIHFRKTAHIPSECSQEKQSGQTIKHKKYGVPNFLKAFVNKPTPFFAKCADLRNRQAITQLIAGGGDGSDVGIMQISVAWHYENFLEKEKYRSVRSTINYGSSHLNRGMKSIARNASKHKCILKSDGTINHLKLAKATWGGWYNGGSTKQACRFADKNSPHVNKDAGFAKNLDNMIAAGNGGKFGITVARDKETNQAQGFWPSVSTQSRSVIKEIVANLYAGTNNRTQLKKLIGQ
jgi:hypothetical protein